MKDVRTPPERTNGQRSAALTKANQIRALRAADKQGIRAGHLNARSILMAPPSHWGKAKPADLMLAIPAIGHTKVDRILRRLHISPSRTLAGMTDDQRRRLGEAIEPYCAKALQRGI